MHSDEEIWELYKIGIGNKYKWCHKDLYVYTVGIHMYEYEKEMLSEKSYILRNIKTPVGLKTNLKIIDEWLRRLRMICTINDIEFLNQEIYAGTY